MREEEGDECSMNELTEKRTPEQIGAEIRMYVDVGRRVTLLCAIEIGRRLVEAKELLSHGEWLPWLERETEFSERSAQRYMRIFEEYGAAQLGLFGPETNATTLSDLPISKALALLSVPESDREAFAEEVDAANISVRELEEKIREREAQVEELQKDLEGERQRGEDAIREKEHEEELMRHTLDEAKKQIAELAKLNQELENRPVEVAVETVRDEAAIAEAAKEAREKAEAEAVKQANKLNREHDKTIKELHEKLEALKTERDMWVKKSLTTSSDASTKIAAAQAEAERIRAELEEAQKKLKASNADVAKFGVWFNTVQQDFLKMMEALREVRERDEETGEKLRGGAVVLLKQLLKKMEPEEKE